MGGSAANSAATGNEAEVSQATNASAPVCSASPSACLGALALSLLPVCGCVGCVLRGCACSARCLVAVAAAAAAAFCILSMSSRHGRKDEPRGRTTPYKHTHSQRLHRKVKYSMG